MTPSLGPQSSTVAPVYLAIGHVVLDVVAPGESSTSGPAREGLGSGGRAGGSAAGRRLGGTVSYAAVTAARLEVATAVVTSCAEDADLSELGSIPIVIRRAAATTSFHNDYQPTGRVQTLYGRAETLEPDDVPVAWRAAPTVHLAAVAGEIPPEVAALFPRARLGVSVQGWLRRWDRTGRVYPARWEGVAEVLRSSAVVFASEEDVAHAPELVNQWIRRAGLVVLTRAERGATVYWRGGSHDSPAFPVSVVDPTGAGDVFAAGFLVALANNADLEAAARYANATASFAVSGVGVLAAPTAVEVAARLAGKR